MKRKYLPIASYPEYNDAVTRLIMNSDILSGSENRIGINTVFWDLTNLKTILLEKTGGPDGRYLDKYKDSQMGELPIIQEKIKDLQLKFEEYCIRREMQGNPAVEKMPPDMQRELYLLEAKQTVCEAEIQSLEKKIKEFQTIKEEADEKKILQYGIKFTKTIQNSTIVDIDFQKVSKLDGQYFIDEKASPYYGMPLENYLKMPMSKGIRKIDIKNLPPYPAGWPNLKAKSHAEAN